MSHSRAGVVHVVRKRVGSERPSTVCGTYWASSVRTTESEQAEATCKRCLAKMGKK